MASDTQLVQRFQNFGLPIVKLTKAMPGRNQDSQIFQFLSVGHGRNEACELFCKCIRPESSLVGIRKKEVDSQVTEILHKTWEIPWSREDWKINMSFRTVASLGVEKKARDRIDELYLMRSTLACVTFRAKKRARGLYSLLPDQPSV